MDDISKCYFSGESGRSRNEDGKHRQLSHKVSLWKEERKKGWQHLKEHREEGNDCVLVWKGMFLIEVWKCLDMLRGTTAQ